MKYLFIIALCLSGCLSEAEIHNLYQSKDLFVKKTGIDNVTCQTQSPFLVLECNGMFGTRPVKFACFDNDFCSWKF